MAAYQNIVKKLYLKVHINNASKVVKTLLQNRKMEILMIQIPDSGLIIIAFIITHVHFNKFQIFRIGNQTK